MQQPGGGLKTHETGEMDGICTFDSERGGVWRGVLPFLSGLSGCRRPRMGQAAFPKQKRLWQYGAVVCSISFKQYMIYIYIYMSHVQCFRGMPSRTHPNHFTCECPFRPDSGTWTLVDQPSMIQYAPHSGKRPVRKGKWSFKDHVPLPC